MMSQRSHNTAIFGVGVALIVLLVGLAKLALRGSAVAAVIFLGLVAVVGYVMWEERRENRRLEAPGKAAESGEDDAGT
jgi:uncharacterized iron-regulated membrane protein